MPDDDKRDLPQFQGFGDNTQKPMKKSKHAQGHLDVFKAFYTIQAEGPFAGNPAVFVRLVGCNLQCPLCDTDYTSNVDEYSPEELLRKVEELAPEHCTLVVITGGEPFRQNLIPLASILSDHGFIVQIETNGTMIDEAWVDFVCNDPLGLFVHTVISPKTVAVSKHCRVLERSYWKYVLEADHVDANDGLPTRVLGYDRVPCKPPLFAKTYIQPLDMHDGNPTPHLQAAVESSLKHGHILTLQSHKVAGLE